MSVDSRNSTPQRSAGIVRAIGRSILWPIRRFFDPRFMGVTEQADHQHADLAHRLEVLAERVQLLERLPGDVRKTLEEKFDDMQDALGDLARAQLDAAREADELIGRSIGTLLAETSAISERIESQPAVEPLYAYRALGGVPPPARILGVGASDAFERTFNALGYDVSCVPDLSGEQNGQFDAALVLSSFAGTLDEAAIGRLGELTTPSGTLVLSVPGSQDRSQLERLLAGWRIEDFTVAADGARRELALVTATRDGD